LLSPSITKYELEFTAQLSLLIQLSYKVVSDHASVFQPDRKDELARIEAAGGKVIDWNGYRVSGILAMSPSIGKFCMSRLIICMELLMMSSWL
jgi:hypothetical protein